MSEAGARRTSTRVIKRVRLDDFIVAPEADGPLHRPVDPAVRRAAELHGPWTAEDDLLLVQAVQQTNDAAAVAREVRFSRARSAADVRERWAALIYDDDVSSSATERLTALHVHLTELSPTNVPWSDDELALLQPAVLRVKRLKQTTPRFTLGDAQSILISGQQQRVFHQCRTAASVLAMLNRLWFERNQVVDFAAPPLHQLPAKLQDAVERAIAAPGPTTASASSTAAPGPTTASASSTAAPGPTTASASSTAVSDLATASASSTAVADLTTATAGRADVKADEREVLAAWLRRRRRMLFLEAEIAADRFFELGKRTLAVLRGEFSRFEMRSKEALIGRPAEGVAVDFDLSKAGPAGRVSARQAVLRFEVDCRFVLINIGHRPIFVCGEPIPTHCKTYLTDNDLVEIGGLPFIFHINQWIISKARRLILPGEADDSGDDDA